MMNRNSAVVIFFLLFFTPIVNASELWVDSKDVHSQEVRRKPLTPEQTLEITRIQRSLGDVDILPLDEWLDGFRRDEDPDQEIAVWALISTVYTNFLKGRDVSMEYKKEVFKVLIASSRMPREDVPINAGVKLLSAKEIIELMDHFYEK